MFFLSNRLIWLSNGNILMNLLNTTNFSRHIKYIEWFTDFRCFFPFLQASFILCSLVNSIYINESYCDEWEQDFRHQHTISFSLSLSFMPFSFYFFALNKRMLEFHSKWTKTLRINEPNKGSKVSVCFIFFLASITRFQTKKEREREWKIVRRNRAPHKLIAFIWVPFFHLVLTVARFTEKRPF